MTNRKQKSLRSFFVLPVFIVSLLVASATAFSAEVYKVKVPEKFGRIKERYQGKSDLVVLYIQDAHSNLEAQKNIASLVDNFVTDQDIHLVGIEGAAGDINMEPFRIFPYTQAKQKVAGEELASGRMGGVLYQSMFSEKPFTVAGLENEALYEKDFWAFINAARGKDDILEQLEEVEQILNQLKTPLLPEDLARLDQTITDYKSDKIDFLKYYLVLNALAERARFDFTEYVHFLAFKEVAILGSNIDFSKLDSERKGLVSELQSELLSDVQPDGTNAKLMQLDKFTKQYEDGTVLAKDYYKYLRSLAYDKNINQRRYPNVFLNTSYLEAYAKVDVAGLVEECKTVEMALMKHFSKSDDTMQLIRSIKAVQVLQLLVGLKAVSQDLHYYEDHKADFTAQAILGFVRSAVQKYNIQASVPENAKWEDSLGRIEKFYQLAEERNKPMLDNLLKAIAQSKSNKAVLVTGGFHTQGMTEMMKEQGISYIAITPQISKVEDNIPYFQAMMDSQVFVRPEISMIPPVQGAPGARRLIAQRSVVTAALAPDTQTPTDVAIDLGPEFGWTGAVLSMDDNGTPMVAIATTPPEGPTTIGLGIPTREGQTAVAVPPTNVTEVGFQPTEPTDANGGIIATGTPESLMALLAQEGSNLSNIQIRPTVAQIGALRAALQATGLVTPAGFLEIPSGQTAAQALGALNARLAEVQAAFQSNGGRSGITITPLKFSLTGDNFVIAEVGVSVPGLGIEGAQFLVPSAPLVGMPDQMQSATAITANSGAVSALNPILAFGVVNRVGGTTDLLGLERSLGEVNVGAFLPAAIPVVAPQGQPSAFVGATVSGASSSGPIVPAAQSGLSAKGPELPETGPRGGAEITPAPIAVPGATPSVGELPGTPRVPLAPAAGGNGIGAVPPSFPTIDLTELVNGIRSGIPTEVNVNQAQQTGVMFVFAGQDLVNLQKEGRVGTLAFQRASARLLIEMGVQVFMAGDQVEEGMRILNISGVRALNPKESAGATGTTIINLLVSNNAVAQQVSQNLGISLSGQTDVTKQRYWILGDITAADTVGETYLSRLAAAVYQGLQPNITGSIDQNLNGFLTVIDPAAASRISDIVERMRAADIRNKQIVTAA